MSKNDTGLRSSAQGILLLEIFAMVRPYPATLYPVYLTEYLAFHEPIVIDTFIPTSTGA